MARKAVFNYVSSYYKRVLHEDFKTFYPFKSDVWQKTDLLPEKPGNVADLLDQYKNKIELNAKKLVTYSKGLTSLFIDAVLNEPLGFSSLHEGNGGHLSGYNPNCGNHPSSLGMLYMMLAGIHNKTEWRSLDQIVLRWLMDMVGFGENASGFFTSGGSTSTAVAMLAAREASRVPLSHSDRSVVYLTNTVHNCAEKAIRMVGLGEIIFRRVLHDSRRKLVVPDLEEKIQEDLENQLHPFMIIGTMGEVNSGAIDPMEDIATVADKHDMWFHVDAAYGGCFLMCDDIKHKARGIDLADSVIVNLHKGLFQPFSSSACLFKKDTSKNLFATSNKTHNEENRRNHPFEEEPPFRAFPAWMSLNVFGVKHFQILLLEKVMLCNYLYRYLKMCPGVTVPIKPELSKVLFALEDDGCDMQKADRKTNKLCRALNKGGNMTVDTTEMDGRVYIHMCVSSLRSHFQDIEYFIQRLKTVAADDFNLVFPDTQGIISQDTKNHLQDMGEFYDAVERYMSEDQISEAVARAAEKYRRGVLLSAEDSFLFETLSECKVPSVNRGIDIITLSCTNSSSCSYNTYQKNCDTVFEIPQDPKSLLEIMQQLSRFSPREEDIRMSPYEDEADQVLQEPAIMGHYLANCLNQTPMMWAFTPGGTELEEMIPDWLGSVAGFSATAKGVLCDDSRSADTLCLAAARNTKLPHPQMHDRAVVYGSRESLQTASQSLHVVGLSSCQKVVIKSTPVGLDVDALMTRIQNDFQDGRKGGIPFLVFLSINSSGLEARSEKLRNLMTLCHLRGLWVHIHVSDGTPFLLADLGPCPVMKESGLAEADSISVDLTECLCQPQTVAVALVQDHNLLRTSLEPQSASPYLPDLKDVKFEPANYALELCRPTRSVPLWFSMHLLGEETLRQHIAGLHFQKARSAALSQ